MGITLYTNIGLVHKRVYKHDRETDVDRKNHGGTIDISYPTTEVVGHGSFGVVVTTVIIEIQSKSCHKESTTR